MTRLRMLAFLLLLLGVPDRAFACESVEGLLGTYQVCRNAGEFRAAARAAGIDDLGIETFGRFPQGLYFPGVFDQFYDDPFGALFTTYESVDSTISVHGTVNWGHALRGRSGFYGVALRLGSGTPRARAIGFNLALEPLAHWTPTSVFVYLDQSFSRVFELLEPGFVGIVAPASAPFQSVTVRPTNYGTMVLDNIQYPGGPASSPDNPIPPEPCPPPFGWWCFDARMGPEWYDPTPTTGFQFRTLTGSFTAIDDFPPGFGDAFTVTAGGTILGTFAPGQRVEFPAGVTQFRITGITPEVDAENPTAFPIMLSLDTVGAIFSMEPIDQTDDTPPIVTPHVNGVAGHDGWYLGPVGLSWTTDDPESGLSSTEGCDASTLLSDTPGITTVCTATNGAGLSTSGSAFVKIDQVAPHTVGLRAPAANGNGWNNSPVTVTFQCADATSGLAAGSPPAGTVVSTEGTGQAVTGTCADVAGNSSSVMVPDINIDLRAPTIVPPPNQVVSQPGPTAVIVNYPPPAVTDTGSGLTESSCIPASGATFPVGATTVNCTASDRAGNTASAAFTVTVTSGTIDHESRVFGPRQYVATAAAPDVHIETFVARAGKATLAVTWKDPSGHSPNLVVRVNGVVVMTGGSTGSSGALVQSITLQSENSLELTMTASVGAHVVLKVLQ